MKKLFLLFTILFTVSCVDNNTVRKKFTISCPDKSGQMRYYYETDKFTITDSGCIVFVPKEDSTQEYTICNNYDIERN